LNKKIVKTGELRLHRDGYGFVCTGKAEEEDIFVPARYIGDALHTDMVEVEVAAGRGGKREGKIRRVLERRVNVLLGRLEHMGRYFRVIADDARVRRQIQIPDKKLGGARHGQYVVVRINKYPKGQEPMQGEVLRVLGNRGSLDTEKHAVIIHHQLPTDFPKEVIKEADACFNLMTRDVLSGRRDLRNINFVTIDGETARDFDDAVAVARTRDGNIRLWVSIADVSHFIKERTALDREALSRGNSVYFPDDCLPMLPQQLSNDLCSLKPKVDRLTVTAEMDIDANGNVLRSEFYDSMIRSRERMTYTAVKKILVDDDPETKERYKELLSDFELMEECFGRLRKKRMARGSIDFDLPEPEIIIDLTGGIEEIVKAERHVGHMMIEEFMIAANESVAEFLTNCHSGCIYRVHDRPAAKKIYEFAALLENLGYDIKLAPNVTTKTLARIVDLVRGSPHERLVNTSLLRSLARAAYSEKNAGHYGLASKCYCHFTSPIRRYPDLVVHRLLKTVLGRKAKGKGTRVPGSGSRVPDLAEIAEHCSRRERIAMDAERETMKLYTAYFMKDKIGKTFEGVISHVTKFGFFVELFEYFIEGVVRKESLPDDKYIFDEEGYVLAGKRHRSSFRIGDPVRVSVESVDITSREVLFNLA
jgi:ribonuclease R